MKRKFWIMAFVLSLSAWAWAGEKAEAAGEAVPTDDPAAWISRYGRPDVDESTANDSPRPPIVTRWLEWKSARVRVTFVPDANLGTPPPYAKWKFIGTQNLPDYEVISVKEAIRRLRAKKGLSHAPAAPKPSPPAAANHPQHEAMVIRIVDGDTMIVMINKRKERVRLRRTDAPEKGEPGYEEATKALAKKFPGGSKVVVTEYARDKYARIVGTVTLEKESPEETIKRLQAENAALKQTIERQTREIESLRNELALLKPSTADPKDDAQETPLEGRDLIAWKMARDAARKTNSYPVEVFDEGTATKASMSRTDTGDYLFTFGREVAWAPKDKRFYIPLRVYVTDLGTTLRVDRVEWREPRDGGAWIVFPEFR